MWMPACFLMVYGENLCVRCLINVKRLNHDINNFPYSGRMKLPLPAVLVRKSGRQGLYNQQPLTTINLIGSSPDITNCMGIFAGLYGILMGIQPLPNIKGTKTEHW